MDESEFPAGENVSNLAELQFSSANSADLITAKSIAPLFCVIFGVSVVADSIFRLLYL